MDNCTAVHSCPPIKTLVSVDQARRDARDRRGMERGVIRELRRKCVGSFELDPRFLGGDRLAWPPLTLLGAPPSGVLTRWDDPWKYQKIKTSLSNLIT